MDEKLRIDAGGRPVSGLWSEPTRAAALVVLAHGAGSDMRHPFYEGISEGLSGEGIATLRFNFPYSEEGRRSPDRPAVLMDAWRGALRAAGDRAGGRTIVASGKSLGGRMASMLAAEEGDAFPASGLVFFGYPLHAPGRTEQLRAAHLPAVRVPMLFIQGDSDSLGRFDLIEGVVGRLSPLAHLKRIEGGDHSFRVRGAKRPDVDIGRDLGRIASGFVRELG
jgi:uncharacterized protein